MSVVQGHNPLHTQGLDSVHEHEHDHDSESLNGKNQGHPGSVRRRPSRAGTRSVSTLSAAQLERKRANDREAQRAIRQRTKENTERLERRVHELEAQLEAVGAGGSNMPALMDRMRQQEHEISILRMRLDQAAIAMGMEGGAALEGRLSLEDPNGRAPDPNTNGGPLPPMNQPQINQAQMASSMMQQGAELTRPGSNYGYRSTSNQWQQASGYGAHSGIKRDTTPSNSGDHSPEQMSSWSGDRGRAPEHHQPAQQAEYAHMLGSQQPPMSMRSGSQPLPYPGQHESHAYPLPPQGNQVAMGSYTPAHPNHQQSYLPHQASGPHPGQQQHAQQPPHPQQGGHAQQSPHVQQLPPPHGAQKSDRDGPQQQVYYGGFPQG